jgi:integrase
MKKRQPKNGSVYQRGQIYWIKYYRNGQPFRESSQSESYQEAERLLKKRQGEIVTGKFAGLSVERIRMSELFDDVVEDYRVNRRKSLVQLESRLKNHVRPAFEQIRASEFSTAHIKRYVAQRLGDGAANATINRELEIIDRAFALAARCEPSKVLRTIHVPMLVEDNVRTGFLDDEGYLRLRHELPEYLRPIFVVAYHVGNRLGELRKLIWQQLDFTNNQILLSPRTTKNKRGRVLPIYGDMREWLRIGKEIRDTKFPDCPHVFHHNGHAIVDFRKTWASACKRAGVPGLLFHDLRRSAIRNMRLAGIPENVAMEISGHRTRAVFDRYSIVGARDIQDAAQKMEQRFTASLGTILGTIGESGQNQSEGHKSTIDPNSLN